jgi:hypothetical protein
MRRSEALKLAKYQKARKAQTAADKKRKSEERVAQFLWDNFEPDISGDIPPMSHEEWKNLIDNARRNKQNIYFGSAWRDRRPQQQAQAPILASSTSWTGR